MIDYLPQLVEPAVQFYSCFLSYSQANADFVERLHSDLQSLGVRTWFAPSDAHWGERLWDQLDSAIRIHDKLVLVLSADSVASRWVRLEVENALAKELRTHTTILFPVMLDDAVFSASGQWADTVRERMIADFRNWRDPEQYRRAVSRFAKALTVTAATELPTSA